MLERQRPENGQIIGEVVEPKPASEAGYSMRCRACGGLVDIPDLAQVMERVGPLPHPAQDTTQ
jgi:hypothetical protein